MIRVDGRQEILGVRTNCHTGVKEEVELNYYTEVGYDLALWFYINPGVTGYESCRITPETIEQHRVRGWCACMGTQARWDGLDISPEQMTIAFDDIMTTIKAPKKPRELTLKDKAIDVIDMIACDETFDDCETRESRVLGLVYCYVHVANGKCDAPHEDWIDSLNKHYTALKSGIPGCPMIL